MECTITLSGTASATITITSRHGDFTYWVEFEPGTSEHHFDITDSPVDQIRLQVADKSEGMVAIKKLVVDGIDLQHCILKGTFYPDYHPQYYIDATPPNSYCPGTDWYHNGEWCMDITKPLWEYMLNNYA